MKNIFPSLLYFLTGLWFNLCILTLSHADDITLVSTPPEKYTVRKGDTLWDISGKYLKHPWQWQELWQSNTQIKNPNLIYPNDTIYFSFVNGKPQLSLLYPPQIPTDNKVCVLKPNEYEKGRKFFLLDKNNKVLPCIREAELKQPIYLIPQDKIASFLTSPKIVTQEELDNAPYIVGFHEGHLLAGTGDKVYVKNLTTPTENTYTIYREGETYHAVDNNQILGIEAKYIASATLLTDNDPATLMITKGTYEIRLGDRIMPSPDIENRLNFFPIPPNQAINAHIIGVKDSTQLVGLYSVVVIDKGSAEGLISGHELTIYQKGRTTIDSTKNDTSEIQLPDEISGKVMVFRPFEHLSYALVMESKHDIHRLDEAKTE